MEIGELGLTMVTLTSYQTAELLRSNQAHLCSSTHLLNNLSFKINFQILLRNNLETQNQLQTELSNYNENHLDSERGR